ncbi:cell division protein FtsW [candidate division KSB1 bacterium]|nr:cell division protein FtsW [candidate division KSB1 bacterium]
MKTSLQKPTDRVLFSAVMILIMIGILMIYSSSSFWGADKYGNSWLYVKNHGIRVALGLILLFLTSRIDYHVYRPFTPVFLLVFFIMLVIVLFVPEFHGAKRSLEIFGKRFQPSEFMKLTMVFYLSSIFARLLDSGKAYSNAVYIHYCVLLATVALIFAEPDLGSALVLFGVGFSIFFLAGVPWGQMAKMIWGIVPVFLLGMVLFPYQKRRMVDYVNTIFNNGELGYQVKQSLIGLANGGLTGAGYGEGRQKYMFLPEPFSDFILAHAGEELGFIGLAFIFGLVMMILWRGYRIAMSAPDRFGFLLAGGITSMILINVLINAGVVLNLLPTTGLTFPFISYGGSSLFVQMMGVGILLNISQKVDVPFSEFTRERSHSAKHIPSMI